MRIFHQSATSALYILKVSYGLRIAVKTERDTVHKISAALQTLWRTLEGSPRQRAGLAPKPDHRAGAYLDALVRAFNQALHDSGKLPGNVQNGFLARLDRVRCISRQLGNGGGGEMDILLSEFDLSGDARPDSGKQEI